MLKGLLVKMVKSLKSVARRFLCLFTRIAAGIKQLEYCAAGKKRILFIADKMSFKPMTGRHA